jgi:tartrate-resistant acid phosphatase type 5
MPSPLRHLTASFALLSLAALAGCSDDALDGAGGSGTSSSNGNGATSSSSSGAGGSATSSSSTTTSSAATSGVGGGGGGEPAEPVLRFVALGDGGEGNTRQYAVAEAMRVVCLDKGGCEFALYLGDNIYNSGADSVTDSQFLTKFEQPYSEITFPFYVALGNHDYGGDGAGYEIWKAQVQVDYTNHSTRWRMPSRYYRFAAPADIGPAGGVPVDFFGLDTNAIMYTGDSSQRNWLNAGTSSSTATWKIGFGHHPYVSNGRHGNAGEYEGIPGIPIVSGGNVKTFMSDAVCNKLDVYFAGHDHNRQWLEPTCGTEFIVSGAAAKMTGLEGRGTPTFYEDDALGGFVLVEISGNTLVGTFYDEQGNAGFSRTVTK